MRISDWSSDVCSSDLDRRKPFLHQRRPAPMGGRLAAIENAALRQQEGSHAHARRAAGACRSRAQKAESGRGHLAVRDRKSVVEGKSVSVSVALGGRCTIKKKNTKDNPKRINHE